MKEACLIDRFRKIFPKLACLSETPTQKGLTLSTFCQKLLWIFSIIKFAKATVNASKFIISQMSNSDTYLKDSFAHMCLPVAEDEWKSTRP